MSVPSSAVAGRDIAASAIVVRATAPAQHQKNDNTNNKNKPDQCKDIHVAWSPFSVEGDHKA